MKYIATTFAHGNGPFSRCIDWAIELNNIREERKLERLPIAVPLVYPGRQERILKEEIENKFENFLTKNPKEIFFDPVYGELLNGLMFKGKDYSENLEMLSKEYFGIEDKIKSHLNGKRILNSFNGEKVEFDLRDAELQLGLNNRIQTEFLNQFYTAGGAGPFDEILERAVQDTNIEMKRKAMIKALPIARRMIQNQKIIFSNEPGVFSYDINRKLRDNEILTPPFIFPPALDKTELPGKGIYLLMTGIDGVREDSMYESIAELGMQIYAPNFSINSLPESIKNKTIALAPSKINNSNIVCQYARAGWSSVWLAHLAEKGFITPLYNKKDDPEMWFNEKGIKQLNLGAIIEENPKSALEKSLELSKGTKRYNQDLKNKYGTLNGIRYAAEKVAEVMHYKS